MHDWYIYYVITDEIPEPGRRRRDCPIKGCNSRQLKQLSTHLQMVHGIKNPIKRRELLRKIRLV